MFSVQTVTEDQKFAEENRSYTVNSLYSGHCGDLKLVSSLVRVCKRQFISVKRL